ncbi:MAG: hypothetical protein RI955_1316 [Bacteroidota bacterium]|jgi:dolichol-phosphate mannosyltransferase
MPFNISIVLSLFNEEEGITNFWDTLKSEITKDVENTYEIIWVNDGSLDNTQQLINTILQDKTPTNFKHIGLEFSKNFGHEAAIIAGIDNSTGDAIICMDSDGQHPASEIKNMIAAFKSGSSIILMKRIQRDDSGFVHKILTLLFYKFIGLVSSIKLENDTPDFFLVSKQIGEILKSEYREKNRYIRGFIQSIGFSTTILPFVAPARKFGESKYSYLGLLKFAITGIFAFSFKPLRISMVFSICFILFSILFSIYTLFVYLTSSASPSGYTSIILFLSISFSLLFLTITMISLYLERLIKEMRQRPIYIVKNKTS